MSNCGTPTQMRLSENTVKNYLFKLFKNLGLSNRVGLILYVMFERKTNFR